MDEQEAPPPAGGDGQAGGGEAASGWEQEKADFQSRLEAAEGGMAAVRTQLASAVSAVRDVVRASHPDIPAELIDGDSVESIQASVAKAGELAAKLREGYVLASGNGKVDAPPPPKVASGGAAPARPDVSDMSPQAQLAEGLRRRAERLGS